MVRSLQQEKKQTVIITTPYAISDEQLDYFKKQLQIPASMTLQTKTDETIIGGFILQYGSNIIDASIQTQVNSLVSNLQNTL